MDHTGLNTEPAKKSNGKGCGCVVYGLIVLVIVLVGGSIAAYFGIKGMVDGLVNEWTEESPMLMPTVDFSPEQLRALETRVDQFVNAVENGQPTAPLELTADELNVLIAGDPTWQELGSRAYLTMDGTEIRGKVSISLAAFSYPGRYINGNGSFTVSLENDLLYVHVLDIAVRGESLPDEILQQIRAENLAKDLNKDPDRAQLLRKLESIKVADGVLRIIAKN